MDLDFLKIEHNNVEPKQGRVLVSEPFSKDAYFKRSVVFLTEHNESGSIGFILNKPVEIEISELLKDFPEFGASVSIGGPVQTNTIHYIHTLGEQIPDSIEVVPGIYWGGDIEHIKLLIQAGLAMPGQIRFFVGYSGWSPNQLDREIKDNYWVVTELPVSDIFSREFGGSWKGTLNKMEKKYKLWTTFPENPEMN